MDQDRPARAPRTTVAEVSLPSPTVSVVMPVYNVAPWVAAAIESALRQTLTNLEVIVVDDGSSDDTGRVVSCIDDPRVRFESMPHQGAAATLNHAVRIASGTFVAFLDGDDLWAPAKLERQIAFMEQRPETDLTFSQSRLCNEHGANLGLTSRREHEPVSFERLYVDNMIGNGSSVVARRTALLEAGPFDTELLGGYDFDVWLRIALLRPANVFCIPAVLTYYRRREGQITKNWKLMGAALKRVLRRPRLGRGWSHPQDRRMLQAAGKSCRTTWSRRTWQAEDGDSAGCGGAWFRCAERPG